MAKPKQDTPMYTVRVVLLPTQQQRHVLDRRMRQARRLYNIALREAVSRWDHLRANRVWRELSRSNRTATAAEKADLRPAYDALRSAIPGMPGRSMRGQYSVSTYLRSIAEVVAPSLGAQPRNALMDRAQMIADRWAGGDIGRPRYSRATDSCSVPGGQHIKWLGGSVRWGKDLIIRARLPERDEWLHRALCSPVQSLTIVERDGVYAAHLLIRGTPPKKHAPSPPGVVGVDPGISHFAAVSDTEAQLIPLRVRTRESWARERRWRRAIERSVAASKAAAEKGERRRRSKAERRLRRQLRVAQRIEATTSRQATNVVARRIAAMGDDVRIEANDYAAMQRARYGRRMSSTRPGALAARLAQVATRVTRLDPWSLALSQTCVCGRKHKKDLHERVHRCECGALADRDLFAAFLARHVEDGHLDVVVARAALPAAESLLRPRSMCAAPSDDRATSVAPASTPVRGAASEPLEGENTSQISAIHVEPEAKHRDSDTARPGARVRGRKRPKRLGT